MYTVLVVFRYLQQGGSTDKTAGRPLSEESAKQFDALQMVLGGWRQNGQILGQQFPIAAKPEGYHCYLNVPEKQALEQRYHNKYVKQWLFALSEAGLAQPKITILGKELDSAPVCACDSPSCYILFSTYLSLESPLRCGDCFGVVPLYTIPPTYDNSEYYNILRWQSDYQNIDHLQMNCTVAESFMLTQLLDPNSDLSQQGLKICREIKAVTEKPVYYYLLKGGEGQSVKIEQQRKCPSCGGDWILDKPWHDLFDFKCESCALLSNIAWTIDEA